MRLWTAGPLQLKAYGITWRDQPGPPVDLQQAARAHVSQTLPVYANDEAITGWVSPSCTRASRAAGC